MNPLIAFYTGLGTDAAGRTLDEVQRQNPAWLEHTHDTIQWLFPLPEPSRFNPSAPALDPATIAVFRQDPKIRTRLPVRLRADAGVLRLRARPVGARRS